VIGAIGWPWHFPPPQTHALGDLAVFLDFGLLGAAGTWVAPTGSFSGCRSVDGPHGPLVIAILHANNWRDIPSDGARRVTTVAGLLGDRGSFAYYGFLIFGPFAIDAALIALPRLTGARLTPMPLTFGLVLLALPSALALWGRAVRGPYRRPLDFVILDGPPQIPLRSRTAAVIGSCGGDDPQKDGS
jgi:1,4-dihydroxy-2-naphthoate octaprenyltransferase